VGDLFDDFMKELRRRQAAASGRPVPPGSRPTGDDDSDADDDGTDAEDAEGTDAERPDADASADDDVTGEGADGDRSTDDPGPIPLRRPRRRPTRGPIDDNGNRRPPPRAPRTGLGGPRDGAFSIRSRVTTIVVLAVIVFVVLMFAVGIELWTDVIWYHSVGFDQVFWTRLGIQGGLFALGGVAALVVLLGNIWLAGRLSPAGSGGAVGGGTLRSWIDRLNEAAANADPGRSERSQWDRWNRSSTGEPTNVTPLDLPDPVPLGRTVIIIVAILAALGIAGTVTGSWETIVLWQHRVPFDPSGTPVVDPIFKMDISFFLFDLPFLRLLQVIASGLLVASLVVTAGRYLLSAMAGAAVFDTRVRVHLGVLAGLFLMTIALGYQLDKLELVHSDRGIASGVSYTDQNAQFLAYNVLTGLSAIAAALLIGGAFARVLWPLGLTLAVWFIASIAIGRLYPAAIQFFTVNPNQQTQETPYIANNITMTRLAFGLGTWKDQPYAGSAPLTATVIADDADTFANARLWDYRPLGDTLGQLQTVRQYYEFYDVDTDRYQLGDSLRQVMLSGRELALEKNTDATGWVNQRIVYTHGIGAAMVPVNEVASQGQPHLIISNLPPTSVEGAPPIKEPRIYFGERPSTYSIVDARQDEFDYPRGVGDPTGTGGDTSVVTTRWSGKTGIPLGTTLDRLLFAVRFRDFNLLISDQVTADSQLLFRRSLGERLPLIAPFLRFDKDPYLVVDGSGRLKYIQDAFTTSDGFPHAQSFDPTSLEKTGLGSDEFNYIRNSVKIVMDAYDGTMTFYVADPSDPIIRAWQGVFPTLFHPISELPSDLVPHLRVPEELFDVQTRMYGRYHVTDPTTFFNNNDLWTVPAPASSKQSLPNEAYYVVMRMPGAEKAEFLLLQPMIPKSRPNMIAWVAAQNDPAVRGNTTVFRFPSESSIFGPAQVEAQIDSDPVISAQTTLWDQAGSTVVRGNLIVVPVGGSLIYLQPVYLQSASSKFPAFQRIVVASPRNIVWGSTLQEALNLLLAKEGQGGGPGPSPSPGPTPTPGPSVTPGPGSSLPPGGDVQQLVDYANKHFELAEAALRNNDFATYGAEIALVKQALAKLEILTGGASPAPSVPSGPSAAPSAAP